MKRNLAVGFLFCLILSSANATEVALVYQNEAAVKSGQTMLGTFVPAGVLISAKEALTLGTTPYLSILGQDLRYASLARLDNDLNVALLKADQVDPLKVRAANCIDALMVSAGLD